MKNDLTKFERDLLRVINFHNQTRYNYKNLMEWNTSKELTEKGMKDGELLYNALGFWVAIKPNKTS